MPNTAPSFETSQYWDSRFTKTPQSFEWLVSPSILIPPLLTALSPDSPVSSDNKTILHIGCGTSDLSNMLRRHVPSCSITNVDFSHQAIRLGTQREREVFEKDGAEDVKGSMSWVTADLLDWPNIRATFGLVCGHSKPPVGECSELCNGDSMPSPALARARRFSVVIEESCADAIACGEDILVPVPYRLNQTVDHSRTAVNEALYIHPVCLLAIHFAALTKPGGSWIALSYSETRFDFLAGDEAKSEHHDRSEREGMEPDPSLLWTVITKQEIISQVARRDGSVHRPKIAHWLYVLRRTSFGVL